MDSSSRPKLVVENDSFLRLIQVVLDPAAPAERLAAFSHFCVHDLPDFAGWCERVRAGAQHLYPAAVRLVELGKAHPEGRAEREAEPFAAVVEAVPDQIIESPAPAATATASP